MSRKDISSHSGVPRSQAKVLRALTVAPEATLLEGLKVIDRGAIELAFVTNQDKQVVGTLSDGDARRAILQGVDLHQPGAVGNTMRKDFVSVNRQTQRAEVLDIMRARSIAQIPVLDAQRRLIGLHLLHDLVGTARRPNLAVIMAGGRGTRLQPYTETVPKPMLTVAGRPILERLVLHLVGCGIRDIFLAINYLGEVVEKHFRDGTEFGCRIQYLREAKPLGTGGPLSLLPNLQTTAGQAPVLAMNGDLVTRADFGQILDFHESGDFIATTCLSPHAFEIPYGVADVRNQQLSGFREKPTERLLINAGIYVLSPEALRLVPNDTEYPITNLIQTCLEQDMPVGAHILDGDWVDVGQHHELRRARGQL